METTMRTPFQGVLNIVRFNWHLYVLAGAFVIGLLITGYVLEGYVFWICAVMAAGIVISTFVSLAVSHYIYDRSGLYDFSWLAQFGSMNLRHIVNINAGFDETSSILVNRFPKAHFQVFDFYDPDKHTEVSIERARKAYPRFYQTMTITTNALPVATGSAHLIFNIFALHEVRDRNERVNFLKEQHRALDDTGSIVVVEHLRDTANFLAYTIGFFHFLARQEWYGTVKEAGLHLERSFKFTPFVSVFVLKKSDGNTP